MIPNIVSFFIFNLSYNYTSKTKKRKELDLYPFLYPISDDGRIPSSGFRLDRPKLTPNNFLLAGS